MDAQRGLRQQNPGSHSEDPLVTPVSPPTILLHSRRNLLMSGSFSEGVDMLEEDWVQWVTLRMDLMGA